MKTSCGKFLNLAHYFPYDVKLRLLAHSRIFLANQKVRNAIVGAENLLKDGNFTRSQGPVHMPRNSPRLTDTSTWKINEKLNQALHQFS